MTTDPPRTFAPWTAEEVEALNYWQRSPNVHPFTCPAHSHLPLLATSTGWICERCGYQQGWAHRSMLDRTHREKMDAVIARHFGGRDDD